MFSAHTPDERLVKVRRHSYVAAQYNLDRKLSKVDPSSPLYSWAHGAA